jgi:hypothetical protein
LENTEEHCEKIGKIWNKDKLNSEMIWKIWKESNLNTEKIGKILRKRAATAAAGGGPFGRNYD